MKAFVVGATGETGRRIVQDLVKRNIPVRALVRDLQQARAVLPEAELVVGDVFQAASVLLLQTAQYYFVLQEPNQALIQLDHIRWTTKD